MLGRGMVFFSILSEGRDGVDMTAIYDTLSPMMKGNDDETSQRSVKTTGGIHG